VSTGTGNYLRLSASPYVPNKLVIHTPGGRIEWWELDLRTEAAKRNFTEKGKWTGWAHLVDWEQGTTEEALKNGSAVIVSIYFGREKGAKDKMLKAFPSRYQASNWVNSQELP
jgi:hypothetical protein